MTDVTGAKEDFLASIELQKSLTQTWVKVASVYMEQGDPKKAFDCFEEAIKHNADDPDIYYHRGQGQCLASLETHGISDMSLVLDHSAVHYERVHRGGRELHQID